jgi:hypothetical protein
MSLDDSPYVGRPSSYTRAYFVTGRSRALTSASDTCKLQLYAKTGVRTRSQLVRTAIERHWKELEEETEGA